MDINSLRQERNRLVTEARAILDAVPADDTLSAEDEARFDALMEDADRHDEQIVRAERAQEAERRIAEAADEPEDLPLGRTDDTAWFRDYLRTGRISEQVRANQITPDDTGGYLIPPQQFVEQLLQAVDDQVVIRSLATVQQLPQAESLGVPTREADVGDFGWTTELATGNEDDSLRFGKRELRPHPLAKRIKVSNPLIRRSPLGAESIVRGRLAYKVGSTQENAFMVGDGAEKPLGLFVASSNGISTGRDKPIGASGSIPLTNATSDQLITAKYFLKAAYYPRARWLFHRDLIAIFRKLKDAATGNYLWQPGFAGDRPDTILDLPYVISEFAPNTISGNAYVGLLGDLSFYWIVDALDFQIQRLVELYAETNQVGFIGRYEGDGMPVLEEAFVRIQVAA